MNERMNDGTYPPHISPDRETAGDIPGGGVDWIPNALCVQVLVIVDLLELSCLVYELRQSNLVSRQSNSWSRTSCRPGVCKSVVVQ